MAAQENNKEMHYLLVDVLARFARNIKLCQKENMNITK